LGNGAGGWAGDPINKKEIQPNAAAFLLVDVAGRAGEDDQLNLPGCGDSRGELEMRGDGVCC